MRIEINGVTYHYDDTGKGIPLLLLHGFTGGAGTWDGLINDLSGSGSFRMIAVDLPGHGETDSPSNPARYDISRVSSDLNDLLEELNLDRVHVLGYSMGGRLALAFANLYPERVESLILESASPGLRCEQERKSRRESDERLARFIEKEGLKAFIDYWEDIPLFSSQKLLPEKVAKRIREERMGNNPIGLANSLRGMGTGSQPSFWEDLNMLEMPVLLISGELDVKFCDIAHKMADCLKRGKKVTVEGAGHIIHVEQPKIFGKMVYDWLIGQVDQNKRRN